MSRFLLIFAILCTLSSCRGPSEKDYLERGAKFFAEKKFEDASLNYRKALQKNPASGQAMYGLALADIKLTRIEQAYAELRRARELMPGNHEVLVTLTELCLTLFTSDPKRFPEMYEEAAVLTRELSRTPEATYDAARLGAYIALTEGKSDRALYLLQHANGLKPWQPEVIVSLLKVLSDKGAETEMNSIASQMLAKNKTVAGVYQVLYSHHMKNGQQQKAQEVLEKRVQANPADTTAALHLCRHFFDTQQTSPFSSCMARVAERAPKEPPVYAMLSDFWVSLGNNAEALSTLQQASRSNPQSRALYGKKIAGLLSIEGKHVDAVKVLDGVLSVDPADVDARLQRSDSAIRVGTPADIERAIVDLKEVIRLQPWRGDAHVSLGTAYSAKGQDAAASEEFATAVRMSPDHAPAHLALSRHESRKRNFSEALRHADNALARDRTSEEARLLRSASLMALGQYGNAQSELQQVLKQNPENEEGWLQLAFTQVALQNRSAAEAIFQRLYTPGKADIRPVIALAELQAADGRVEKAMAMLESELSRSSNPGLRSALVRTAITGGRYAAAAQHFERLPEAAVSTDLLARMVVVYDALNNRAKTIQVCRRAVAADPGNLMMKNNLAFLLADGGQNLDEALTLVQQAQRGIPNSPIVADTLGWIYLKKGQTDQAVSIFSNLTERYPTEAVYQYHLGVALLNNGDRNKAATVLQGALRSRPDGEHERKIKSLLAEM